MDGQCLIAAEFIYGSTLQEKSTLSFDVLYTTGQRDTLALKTRMRPQCDGLHWTEQALIGPSGTRPNNMYCTNEQGNLAVELLVAAASLLPGDKLSIHCTQQYTVYRSDNECLRRKCPSILGL